MRVGIIGYGSMGRMLYERIRDGKDGDLSLYLANRTFEKIETLREECIVCRSNTELASACDVVFICVRPADIPGVLSEIEPVLKNEALVVSLNVNIRFETLESISAHKIAKALPGVTAEIGRSQTLVCFNESVCDDDKRVLRKLLNNLGDVYELKEDEMGMGSELVSCMPGFIAAIFDTICKAAGNNLVFSDDQIHVMVRNTLAATGALMLEKDMSFKEVVERVATKGGVTEEGTKVIYEKLPGIADEMFKVTLEKRKIIADRAKK